MTLAVFMTVGEVARELGLSPDAVRRMERAGKLKAAKTAGGVRLFPRTTIEQLKIERVRRASRP